FTKDTYKNVFAKPWSSADGSVQNAWYNLLENPQFEYDGENGQDSTRVEPGQAVPGTKLKTMTSQQVKDLVGDKSPYLPPIPSFRFSKEDFNLIKMASAASDARVRRPQEGKEKKFRRRCKNVRGWGHDVSLLGLTIVSLIYGGLHAMAWFANFNSTTEQLLWRISSCVVMGGLPIFLVLSFILYHDHLDSDVFIKIGSILMTLIIIAYILARAYLVVECFIQLSHMPAGVYEVPEWSAYFPHLS
ncbi:MAG: hypothetical protein Q9193_007194, partial [Seirophora villosa]